MLRRLAYPFLAAALALPFSACTVNRAPLCAGCNVILVSIDTLRYDRPSFMGYHRKTTPRLDQLVARGIVFENAFAHSSVTLQSHMSMLTGLYPQKHGVLNYPERNPARQQRLPDTVPTLAEVLRRNGIRTLASFKHPFMLEPSRGFARGFEHHRHEAFFDDYHLESVLEQVRPVAAQGQFFLFLHSFRLHDPYLLGERQEKRFLRADGSYKGLLPESDEGLHELVKRCRGKERACLERNHAKAGSRVPPPGPLSEFHRSLFLSLLNAASAADRERVNDLYDSALYSIDSLLGEFFARIEAMNLPRTTLVVLTSDHGEELLEDGELGHARLREPVIHVPLVIFPVGGETRLPAARIPALAQTIDIFPTVLGLLGIESPPVQGRSLVPLILGKEKELRSFVLGYSRMGDLVKSYLRTKEVKLVRSQGEFRMVHARPGKELAPSPENERLKAELEAKLRAFEIYGEDPK